jgi:hypothetical protein
MSVSALTAEKKMFRRHNTPIVSNPTCNLRVDLLTADDFLYYDKDGFELNAAEREYYLAMGYPLQYPCLNHICWQEPWFELEIKYDRLILDHSLILHRANYSGSALDQLLTLKSTIPQADLLIRTQQKWGFDFALDAVAFDGTIYEVLHIEYDHNKYDRFSEKMISFDFIVRHTDWSDAARRIWDQRDQWQHLQGFEQNHWKSQYLLGWGRSEYTEKAI